jgi:hypothetical protein
MSLVEGSGRVARCAKIEITIFADARGVSRMADDFSRNDWLIDERCVPPGRGWGTCCNYWRL